ncbi:MAG: hypothetical protein HOH48_07660, partial [Candidatus Puniceispirillum sp.]|nr:hypothetical protein [Candidatus Puniceispirillum sp.]
MTPHVWARDVDCEALAAKAEAEYAIPSGIMQGIARVESGRVNSDGKRRSWPWTVNDGVEGLFFEDQDSALPWPLMLGAALWSPVPPAYRKHSRKWGIL